MAEVNTFYEPQPPRLLVLSSLNTPGPQQTPPTKNYLSTADHAAPVLADIVKAVLRWVLVDWGVVVVEYRRNTIGIARMWVLTGTRSARASHPRRCGATDPQLSQDQQAGARGGARTRPSGSSGRAVHRPSALRISDSRCKQARQATHADRHRMTSFKVPPEVMIRERWHGLAE
jgi:hypothetical protein